jgi:hypothetical protein
MEMLFILLVPLAVLAFWFFDRWHQGYAWRKADREARAFMDRHHPRTPK